MSEEIPKKTSLDQVFESIPSKISFWLGMLTAVLLLGTIGFFVLGSFILKGNMSFVKPTGQQGTELNANNQDNSDTTAQPIAKAVQVPKVNANDHILGSQQAPLILIEYSDFQCPYCSGFHNSMKQLVNDYNGKVQWVFRHFPLTSLHPQAQSAAEASECANEQGKFWEYADILFANQDKFNNDYYLEIASTLGLNKTNFQNCLNTKKYQTRVEQDQQNGAAAGVNGTPGSFLIDQNGKVQEVKGALPYESLKAMVDNVLLQK
jgi:protein-disulfide isomerase